MLITFRRLDFKWFDHQTYIFKSYIAVHPNQTLTTNCEVITKWHDVFLMWDPAQYDNITDTRLPWEEVWTPDIVLYNAAGDGEQGREMRTLIQVGTNTLKFLAEVFF